ncbi:MAG: hypothetical protein ACXVIJ_01835, partial [Thermoanaerobaculia bacterium]
MLFLATAALLGCGAEHKVATTPVAPVPPPPKRTVRPVAFPFGDDGLAPAVSADGEGGVLVGWLDRRTRSLDVARWRDGRWFQPRTIARGDLAMNKANAPALLAANGSVVAEWIEQRGEGTVVRISRSNDGAMSWTTPVTPNSDVPSENGFLSFAAEPGGSVGAVWLDGRKLEGGREGAGDMELRYAEVDADGKIANDRLLDPRVCDCCQTSIAMTSNGPIVVYRDRSAEEIRDISVVRRTGDEWTKPKTLHRDGWHISGCPVNGPRTDAAGLNVVAAWYSAANREQRVEVAFSRDGGATFEEPVRVGGSRAAGHVDVVMLADGSAIVTWIEQGDGSASIEAARVGRDRKLGP